MMNLKALCRRFRAWQVEPFHYDGAAEPHTCANLGMTGLSIIFLSVLFIGYWIGKRQAARRKG